MPNDVAPSQAEVLSNPEAAVESLRVAFARGKTSLVQTALQNSALAMMAFGLQRQAAVEDAEALARSLLAQADDGSEDDERVIVSWATHGTSAVAAVARSMRALMDCRFDLTAGLAEQVQQHSQAASTAWQRMLQIEPDAAQEPDLALWVGLLQRLPLVARMFDAQSQAQRHLLMGDRLRYVEGVHRVLQIVDDERHLVAPVDDAYAPIIRQLLGVTAKAVQAQLDFVNRSLSATDLGRFQPAGRKVFIVHGHDEGSWRALQELLGKEFALDTLVLKQEASATRTLIQKFEAEAADCAFAIVLVTPDDLVKKGKVSSFQARPNVLFELGWFYGRLGPGRVTILQKGGKTDLPSDLRGIVTLVYEQNVNEVLVDLRAELDAAGLLLKPAARGRRPAVKKATAPSGKRARQAP
jgi:predicted nucleotide-binding protein